MSADHGQGVNAGAVGVDAFTGLRGGDGGPPFSREYVGDLGAGPVRVRGADNDRNPASSRREASVGISMSCIVVTRLPFRLEECRWAVPPPSEPQRRHVGSQPSDASAWRCWSVSWSVVAGAATGAQQLGPVRQVLRRRVPRTRRSVRVLPPARFSTFAKVTVRVSPTSGRWMVRLESNLPSRQGAFFAINVEEQLRDRFCRHRRCAYGSR